MTPQNQKCTDGSETATTQEEATRLSLLNPGLSPAHKAAVGRRLRQLRADAITRGDAVLPWAPN